MTNTIVERRPQTPDAEMDRMVTGTMVVSLADSPTLSRLLRMGDADRAAFLLHVPNPGVWLDRLDEAERRESPRQRCVRIANLSSPAERAALPAVTLGSLDRAAFAAGHEALDGME